MSDDLSWHDLDSVGEPTMDADHRRLSELAQNLVWSLTASATDESSLELLDDLVEAALTHFEQEEQLLAAVRYPELAEHQASHNRLLRAILHFREDVRRQRYQPEAAAKFIQAWVLEHVRSEDARYAAYLAGRETPSDVAM